MPETMPEKMPKNVRVYAGRSVRIYVYIDTDTKSHTFIFYIYIYISNVYFQTVSIRNYVSTMCWCESLEESDFKKKTRICRADVVAVASETRQPRTRSVSPLRSGARGWDLPLQCLLRSGAHSWSPAAPTEIWSSLMPGEGGRKEGKKPHPAGGGKIKERKYELLLDNWIMQL